VSDRAARSGSPSVAGRPSKRSRGRGPPGAGAPRTLTRRRGAASGPGSVARPAEQLRRRVRDGRGRVALAAAFATVLLALLVGGLAQFGLARGPGRRVLYRFGRYLGLTPAPPAARECGRTATVHPGGRRPGAGTGGSALLRAWGGPQFVARSLEGFAALAAARRGRRRRAPRQSRQNPHQGGWARAAQRASRSAR
jgi:hypothetical protein